MPFHATHPTWSSTASAATPALIAPPTAAAAALAGVVATPLAATAAAAALPAVCHLGAPAATPGRHISPGRVLWLAVGAPSGSRGPGFAAPAVAPPPIAPLHRLPLILPPPLAAHACVKSGGSDELRGGIRVGTGCSTAPGRSSRGARRCRPTALLQAAAAAAAAGWQQACGLGDRGPLRRSHRRQAGSWQLNSG
jgi:hypothetical protein